MKGLEKELDKEMPKEYQLHNKLLALVIEDFIVEGVFDFEQDMTASLTKRLKDTFCFYFDKIEVESTGEGTYKGYVKAFGCLPLEFSWGFDKVDVQKNKDTHGL